MLLPRLLGRPACQLISQTSSASRTTTCRPTKRSFHASTPRPGAVLDSLVYLPNEMMNLIHTAVPWYATIPITAFIVRGLLVTTAGSWARSELARYIGLQPLRQALAFKKTQDIYKRGGFRDPKQAKTVVQKEVKALVTGVNKRWNISLVGQVGWITAQLPIFFTMAEAIRTKCSGRQGILGLLIEGNNIPESSTVTGDLAAATSKWFEPSLANEGALWFPDLLAADPTGALPFIVSGLMFTNIFLTKNTVQSDAKFPKTIRYTLMGVSLLIGPLCQQLPAALMLYWAGSTSSVIIWNYWLDWKHPIPRAFTACGRPLQMPPVSPIKQRKP